MKARRRNQQPSQQEQANLNHQIDMLRQQALLEAEMKIQQLLASHGATVQPKKNAPKKRPRKASAPAINPFVLFAILVLLYLLIFKL